MFKQLKLKDFMVFKKADFTFGERLNIMIGENGSGKTQLMKLLYALDMLSVALPLNADRGWDGMRPQLFLDNSQASFKPSEPVGILKKLYMVHELAEMVTLGASVDKRTGVRLLKAEATMGNEGKGLTITVGTDGGLTVEGYQGSRLFVQERQSAIFLPARELLTMYRNYLPLSAEYEMPYDLTFDKAIVKLGLPYKREHSPEYLKIIASLEEAIQGRIFLKDEKFYYHPDNAPLGLDFDINMAAEGWRRLGTLTQLLRNGSLRKGMALLWDEPEANLNPRLIRLIAQTILELSKLDIQVFIATQSLFLVNELEILISQQKIKEGVRFFNLRKDKTPQQGDCFSALKNVLLLDEEMKQSDRYMDEEV